MKDMELQKRIENAVDTTLASLDPSARQCDLLIENIKGGKKSVMGKKVSITFVFAIVMMIACIGTAVALSYTFIQKAVQNQQESGPLEKWSIEEKQSVIDAMVEDGLAVDEIKYAAMKNASTNEQKQRIANEILLESKLAREELINHYGFTDDSFQLFDKTVLIDGEAGTWNVAYMPTQYSERIGQYVVVLDAITGNVVSSTWSYDHALLEDTLPDTWDSKIWSMEKVNRLLRFDAERMEELEKLEAEKGEFDYWSIQDKAAFDEEIISLGYPRNDFVVNVLPQADDVDEQKAFSLAEGIVRERLGESSLPIQPITISFYLLADDTKEWMVVVTAGDNSEVTYTVEIASPSGEILSCSAPLLISEKQDDQATDQLSYQENEILDLAWDAMRAEFSFNDNTHIYFNTAVVQLDDAYEVIFKSNNYNPAKVGIYTVKLNMAEKEILSIDWSLQHEYEQQGPKKPWKAAELWSSYEYNEYATLRENGKAVMKEAGSDISWGMDFEHQAAYDTLYREAGFDRTQYYHALPSTLDLSKEEAIALAINTIAQKYILQKEVLENDDILYEFDVSEEDRPLWRISILDEATDSVYIVEIQSINNNIIKAIKRELSN